MVTNVHLGPPLALTVHFAKGRLVSETQWTRTDSVNAISIRLLEVSLARDE